MNNCQTILNYFDIINRFSEGYEKEKEETSFEISSRVSLCSGRYLRLCHTHF